MHTAQGLGNPGPRVVKLIVGEGVGHGGGWGVGVGVISRSTMVGLLSTMAVAIYSLNHLQLFCFIVFIQCNI